jgi:hypothetical protein
VSGDGKMQAFKTLLLELGMPNVISAFI